MRSTPDRDSTEEGSQTGNLFGAHELRPETLRELMEWFGHDLRFWLAVFGATVVKVATSPYHSFKRAMLTVFAAVFSAWAFTDPVIAYLNLDPDSYRNMFAALLALTGEGFMRFLIAFANNPTQAIEWYKVWRGKS
jgi:hypothetical protein